MAHSKFKNKYSVNHVIASASEAISISIRDCHVAIAPHNDTKERTLLNIYSNGLCVLKFFTIYDILHTVYELQGG